ncbi:MAG TPA: hypothetical protein DEH25_17475 [Chloroflexi bacterium]|nr:hypothetical protein [Chloroflexota bacterium]
MDIICISTTDWDEIWGSRQQIMLQMVSKGHRVLFVERQVGLEHLLRDKNMRRRKISAFRESAPVQIQLNLWRWQPPLMYPGRYYSLILNKWGQRYLSARLKPILNQLGFTYPILWMYPPQSAPLIGQFSEKLSIYHCIEHFAGDQKGRKQKIMLAQENALLREVDQVFVHADGLRKRYAPLTRRPIELIPSAADVAHFQSTDQIHPTISAIPHPRLVLMGTLDARIDHDLLYHVMSQNPNWSLVLIGQMRSSQRDFAPLLALPNVYYLGKQLFADLPTLLNGADIALIPYVLTEMTRAISPIKAYEYLAVGNPIVSVNLPEIAQLKPWIYKVDNLQYQDRSIAEIFTEAITTALETESPSLRDARRQAAQEHSWQARANRMQQTIQSVLREKADAETC